MKNVKDINLRLINNAGYSKILQVVRFLYARAEKYDKVFILFLLLMTIKQVKTPISSVQRRSFWLRCWQISGQKTASGAQWRFSLEDPQSGQKVGFTSVQGMIIFLLNELGIVESLSDEP
jgi:hypothetical protein